MIRIGRPLGAAMALTVVLAGLLVAGCVSPSVRPPSTSTAAPSAPTPTPTGAAEAVESEGILPAALVGSWTSSQPTTEIAYRFAADGGFRSVEILSYLQPLGVFEFRVVQSGRVEVVDNTLVLRPTAASTSKQDPEHPAENFTDRPRELVPRQYIWQVTGGTLRLRDDAGLTISLERVS